MKKADLIDGIQTVLTFLLIFATFYFAMVIFSGCGSTQSVCPAYKDKPKVERTKVSSRASDPKPRVYRSYSNCIGCR